MKLGVSLSFSRFTKKDPSNNYKSQTSKGENNAHALPLMSSPSVSLVEGRNFITPTSFAPLSLSSLSVLPPLLVSTLFSLESIPLKSQSYFYSMIFRMKQSFTVLSVKHVQASSPPKWENYEGLSMSDCITRSVLSKPKRIHSSSASHTTAPTTWSNSCTQVNIDSDDHHFCLKNYWGIEVFVILSDCKIRCP